jgi:hypothetical protein
MGRTPTEFGKNIVSQEWDGNINKREEEPGKAKNAVDC